MPLGYRPREAGEKMAPSHFLQHDAQNERLPTHSRDNEAEPPGRETTATAIEDEEGAAVPVVQSIEQDVLGQLHGHLPHPSASRPHGMPPTILPPPAIWPSHGQGNDFNGSFQDGGFKGNSQGRDFNGNLQDHVYGFHYPHYVYPRNAHMDPAGPVPRPPQTQPAWMQQLAWMPRPSADVYRLLDRQLLYPGAQMPYAGLSGSQYAGHGRPQAQYEALGRQHMYGGTHVPEGALEQLQGLNSTPQAPYATPERRYFNGTPQVPYTQLGSPYLQGNHPAHVLRTPEIPTPAFPRQVMPWVENLINQAPASGTPRPRRVGATRPVNAATPVNATPPSNAAPSANSMPPVQEWPTWNLTLHAVAQKKHERKSKAAQDRAQELINKRMAEAALRQSGDRQPAVSSAPSTSEKRKLSIDNAQSLQTLPPPLRHSTHDLDTDSVFRPEYGLKYQSQSPDNSMTDPMPVLQLERLDTSNNTPQSTRYYPVRNKYRQNEFHAPSAGNSHDTETLDLQHCPDANEPILLDTPSPSPQDTEILSPAEPVSREDTYQPISDKYEDYKWPVRLYELRSDTEFDFAHTYMDDWFEKNIFSSDRYKWHCHTTKGFIKGGNRFSILVLHNAADPFTWNSPSETTTSIAFYGRFGHSHEEFRWTTVTPWIRDFFGACADFVLRNEWNLDMPKASDRRFHRAYWLAANMSPLGNLLNRHPLYEKPHDEPEPAETEEELSFTKDDLQSQWIDGQPSAEQSQKIWQRIIDEVEYRDMRTLGSDHIAIGGSERQYESEFYD